MKLTMLPPRLYAMLMILISLPLTAILYMRSKKLQAMTCLN